MSLFHLINTASEIGGGSQRVTTSHARDTNYVDEEIEFPRSDLTRVQFPLSAPTSVWVHFRVFMPSQVDNLADGYWMEFYDQAGNRVAFIEMFDGVSSARTAVSGSTIAGSNVIFASSTLYTLDLHCEITATDVVFSIYNGGTLTSQSSQAKSSITSIDRFDFMWFNISRSDAAPVRFSEIIIADEDTRGMRLATLKPNANGAETGWNGDFNDVDVESGSAITSSVAGARETFDLSAYAGLATTTAVRTVAVKTIGSAPASNPREMKHLLRLGTTNYEGAQFAPQSNEWKMTAWDTDPSTTAPWDTADLGALQAGVRAENQV